jgi:hypothetical protein
MNIKLVLTSLLFAVASANLNENTFYKADVNQYTPELCLKITANDFILAIKSNEREAEKPAAFKALFDGCRNRFLYDGEMAKHIIVQMAYTGNTEHLPLLLNKGIRKTIGTGKDVKFVYDNLEMDKDIIKLVEYYLFVVNAFPTDDTRQYFFLLRKPERALAYILAYTNISKFRLEEVRELLENFSNHPSKSEFADSRSIDRAIELVDGYLKKPETVGNHKFMLSVKVSKTEESHESGDWFMIIGIFLGLGSVLSIVLGLLWKFKSDPKPSTD